MPNPSLRAGIWSGVGFHRFSASVTTVSLYFQMPCCVQMFPCSDPSSLALTLLLTPAQRSLRLGEQGVTYKFTLGLIILQSFIL